MIKRFLITLFFVCQLQAMETCSAVPITLLVLPSATFSLTGVKNRPDVHGSISASLYGFSWKNNKIELAQNHPHWDFSSCLSSNKSYTPETMCHALQAKIEPGYPIQWHKKIELTGNEELTVLIRDTAKGQEIDTPVPLSDTMKNRLLHFLTYDTQQETNAFDLCNEVALARAQPQEAVNNFASLITYIDFIDQQDILPGDVIGLFSYRKCDRYGYSSLLKLKHYTIALTSNIYLSKMGSGGILLVSDLQSLKDFWKCSGHVKIDPAIGKRDDFIDNPFCSIPYRAIALQIFPHHSVTVDGVSSAKHLCFMAWLAGLRCTQHQIQLRQNLVVPIISDKQQVYNTSQQLNEALLVGLAGRYPLHDHKKLCYLAGDEKIRLCIINADDTGANLNLPEEQKRKLLEYLLKDTEDKKKCCYHFCKFLCLKGYNNFIIGSYESQWDYVDEKDLKPGDAVALGKGNSIEHWTVALGNYMYLSQHGNGERLAVTNMAFMMKYFNCNGFVRIKPTITHYDLFMNHAVENFDTTSIQFI